MQRCESYAEHEGKFYAVEKTAIPQRKTKKTQSFTILKSQLQISLLQAYEYVVNGKSAIEWVMERYQVSTHKESGITNNPNDWANRSRQPTIHIRLVLSQCNKCKCADRRNCKLITESRFWFFEQ
jgi:predicted helicase